VTLFERLTRAFGVTKEHVLRTPQKKSALNNTETQEWNKQCASELGR
jgi:hypothetical protein